MRCHCHLKFCSPFEVTICDLKPDLPRCQADTLGKSHALTFVPEAPRIRTVLKSQDATSRLPHIIPARCHKAVPCGERFGAVSARFCSCRGIGARHRRRHREQTILVAPPNPQPFAGRVLANARRRPEPPHAGAYPSWVGPRKGRTRSGRFRRLGRATGRPSSFRRDCRVRHRVRAQGSDVAASPFTTPDRVLISRHPTDMRAGIQRLASIVVADFGGDP